MKQRVEGYSNLYKDTTTGVITNCGFSERTRYRTAKHQAMLSKSHQHEINSLRDEMTEIKSLLHQLLNK